MNVPLIPPISHTVSTVSFSAKYFVGSLKLSEQMKIKCIKIKYFVRTKASRRTRQFNRHQLADGDHAIRANMTS